MRNTRTTDAYKLYYENRIKGHHNNPALIDMWGADPGRLETQIMCHKAGVKLDNGKYECDGEVFGPHRWPYDPAAEKGEPNYSDPQITYVIDARMKAIGTTWWNWKDKRTVGLGFDFDSKIGHAEGVGIDDEQLAKLDRIDVPWLEVIRSTRGNGRHIYIWFQEPYPITMNHTEHAAIARSFIPLITQHTKLDIAANIDVCGGVMWIHHVESSANGYSVVKPATQILTADHVPPNWRDHLEVVSGSRTKVRVQGWTADGTATNGDELDEMTEAYAKVVLDETHLKILEDLESTGHTALWVSDHHLWQGHTGGLKHVFDAWADAGHPMRGLFDTNSLDQDPGKPNCLGGDTKVITREGVKPIRDLACKTVEIITSRGAWKSAPFKSYGVQDVFTVTLKRGKDTRTVVATGDHRWYICKYRSDGYRKTKVNFGERKEVTTLELEQGQILVQTKPQLSVSPSIVGIQHGLVWGGTEILNLPYHFKSLVPLQYDKAYLYGWLAGYFAADGCVSEQGTCIIRSADKESIEHVKQICHILGIETSQLTEGKTGKTSFKPDSPVFTTCLKASDLTEDFFLLSSHRNRFNAADNRQHHYWRVDSVTTAGSEEVFCCTVPETHCFCLEDFILIGNCFMRPKPDGAWDVYRFGEGTEECSLWDSQGKWTHTTYNFPATLKQICLSCGGYEGTDEKQGYLFDEVDGLKEALLLLGSGLRLPKKTEDRALALHNGDDGKVILVIERKRQDEKSDFPRYVKTTRGWEMWIRDAIETPDVKIDEEKLWTELDDKMRSLKTCGSKGAAFDSWVLRDESGGWTTHPRENIKSYLVSTGHTKPDMVLGGAIYKSWTLVNEPFQAEYPGGRVWNRDAPQFVYAPIELGEDESPAHPTWDRLMDHCGVELNEYIPDLPWCKDWGIETGGDYLTAWVACMFQNPFGKLPYLFMYGPQNSGKSSFHEAIALLLTNGVEKADRALTSTQGYNGELVDTVLAVVDEVDIAKAGSEVYNKLKEWVTGMTISIHAKYKQVQDITSTLHFVQMANNRRSLPVFPGDTRITAMNVPSLEEEIPRDRFHDLLRAEGAHFMRTLIDFEIPPATGRLMLPVIETQGKLDAAADSVDELERFITENCFEISGAAIKFTDFKARFLGTLEVYQQTEWKERVIRSVLSERFLVGRCLKHNQQIIGNLSFEPNTKPGIPYTKNGGNLVKEGEA
jgi:hypothetical protein